MINRHSTTVDPTFRHKADLNPNPEKLKFYFGSFLLNSLGNVSKNRCFRAIFLHKQKIEKTVLVLFGFFSKKSMIMANESAMIFSLNKV